MIAIDLMTPKPRTVRVTSSIAAALDILWSMDVRHLPVVDDEGELVGILSDRDVGAFMKTFDQGAAAFSNRTVGQLMSGDVITVDVDADVTDVIETLVEERIGAVPVVDGEGALAGIISYVDVLRAYAGELGAPPRKAKPKANGRSKTNGKAARVKTARPRPTKRPTRARAR